MLNTKTDLNATTEFKLHNLNKKMDIHFKISKQLYKFNNFNNKH